MSDEYRLVYSGELLDGQHVAVVKKRLAAVLKLDDEPMTVLFSGKSVVVKKATDEKTAARYQAAFQKAGARLRVLPVEDDLPLTPMADPIEAAPQPSRIDQSVAGLQVMPEGSLVIAPDERREVAPIKVETDHLEIQGAGFAMGFAIGFATGIATDDAELPMDVPNVEHITIAELVVTLGREDIDEVVSVELDANFDLADPDELMDAAPKEESPAPPDTSHIKLDDKEDDETV